MLRKIDMTWGKVILGKFFGGVLSIGSGLSLGREGPSVQLGAAVGQGFSRVFKRIKVEEKYLITGGASAGLAAAFNAPLAGVMFALEEVHKNFSPLVLLTTLSAALSSDFIASSLLGENPIFNLSIIKELPLSLYFYIIILGVILGVLGAIFNKVILKTQNLYSSQTWLPKEFYIILPLIFSIIVGILLPQALGGGHELINLLMKTSFSIKILIIIVVVKFLFTMASYESGAPGGIFLPLLAVGALIGNVYGITLVHLIHFDGIYINALC